MASSDYFALASPQSIAGRLIEKVGEFYDEQKASVRLARITKSYAMSYGMTVND